MQVKNDILEELKAISIPVSGISRQIPYVAPAGYFESLPQQVLHRIASKSLTFSVPDGYFDNFASRVLDRIKAGRQEEGAGEELARLSATVSGISRETPYRLPEGYFEEVSPILALLKDRPTYEAPVGYFDDLAAVVTAKISQPVNQPVHRPAKVIGMGNRVKVLTGNWWKYSAAAIVAGIILTLSWPQLFMANTTGVAHALPLDMSKVLAKVSDQEMQNYIDDQHSILAEPVGNSTASDLDISDSDVRTLLGDVPDGELKQYMEEHGRANDIATN
jgi:hypothetical protein